MALLLPYGRDLRREARSGRRVGHAAQPAADLQQGEELHHGGAHHLAPPHDPLSLGRAIGVLSSSLGAAGVAGVTASARAQLECLEPPSPTAALSSPEPMD